MPDRILTTHVGVMPRAVPQYHRPICRGPIQVKDLSGLHKDIANLNVAVAVSAKEPNAGQLPQDKVLVPGVLDTVNNFIEHPRLIAQRLKTYAGIVGRERVMAGTDCGFGTFAGFGAVHPSIAYAKLESMAVGADMASKELWA